MERVTFLCEDSGDRISCLLNPEDLVQRRSSGLRPQWSGSGPATGAGLTDEPLLHTGGGRTELDLELLFDTSLLAAPTQVGDVRDLTKPLWDLSENAFTAAGSLVPAVRFVWGKAWNVLAVVVAVSERLERFDGGGAPSRSWMKVRLRRIPEPPIPPVDPPTGVLPVGDDLLTAAQAAPLQSLRTVLGGGAEPADSASAGGSGDPAGPQVGERLDEIAAQAYQGAAWLWRWIAAANGLDSAPFVPAGTELAIPAAPGSVT